MAKLTRKQMYAEYGIEYRASDSHIYCEPLGIWIPLLMTTNTNTKIGNAATWSILHGNELYHVDDFDINKFPKLVEFMRIANIEKIKGSCPMHCKDCYCDSGRYVMDSVKSTLMLKLILATFYKDWLFMALLAQVKVEHLLQIRIHVAGDFSIDDEYIDMWVYIVSACDGVVFWTYTKNPYALEVFKPIGNVFITPSITPLGINYGKCADLIVWYNKLTSMGYRVHICACNTPYQNHCAECKHGCKAINIECDFVLFIQHSTKGYKPGITDPLEYSIICDIVAKQNN